MSNIHETCSCSSQFRYSSRSDIECQIAAMMWREGHIHELPKPKEVLDVTEQHDTQLDSYLERTDHRDMNPAAELDHRTRIGFQPKPEPEGES